MPKNIYLIENYKKVEEIKEINTEIPSYEEFLKNYQTDQGINESYDNEIENYSDIGTSKGFGPCSWNNPNCSCYISQGYTPLRMACPNGSSSTASNWYHSSSGYLNASDQSSCGTLVISGQGYIKCANCGTAGNWEQWKFKSSEQCSYNYATSSREFLSSLQSAMGMYNDSNSRDIIRQLVISLMRN